MDASFGERLKKEREKRGMTLEEVSGGTRLTVVETGFDALPLARREAALTRNTRGWSAQLENVARHVAS